MLYAPLACHPVRGFFRFARAVFWQFSEWVLGFGDSGVRGCESLVN